MLRPREGIGLGPSAAAGEDFRPCNAAARQAMLHLFEEKEEERYARERW
jgi:hypothetical protein